MVLLLIHLQELWLAILNLSAKAKTSGRSRKGVFEWTAELA